MGELRGPRLVAVALRCYPARWRRRHGAEAAELATLLIRDGTPAVSVALSYLAGAAREWLTPRPGRMLTALACALLAAACSVGVTAGLLASAPAARAASTAQAPGPESGHQPGQARCRPGSPELFLQVVPATVRAPLIGQGTGHDQSC